MVAFLINDPVDILILIILLKSIFLVTVLSKCSKILIISQLQLYDIVIL